MEDKLLFYSSFFVILITMKDIYKYLDDLNISYKKYEHEAVFTVEEAKKARIDFEATDTKNLFLRNKKKNAYYLVVLDAHKPIKFSKLQKLLNENKLSFASPEDLMKYLSVTPGSVSPFTLINNEDRNVNVIIDNDLIKNNKIGFHPNINTATLVISSNDFKKFLDSCDNKVSFINL